MQIHNSTIHLFLFLLTYQIESLVQNYCHYLILFNKWQ